MGETLCTESHRTEWKITFWFYQQVGSKSHYPHERDNQGSATPRIIWFSRPRSDGTSASNSVVILRPYTNDADDGADCAQWNLPWECNAIICRWIYHWHS